MPGRPLLRLDLAHIAYKPIHSSLLTKSPLMPSSTLHLPLKSPVKSPLKSPAFPSTSNFLHITSPSSSSLSSSPSPSLSSSAISTSTSSPPQPLPWTWRCHLCSTTYHLSATRRCLKDGHRLCSTPSVTISPVTPPESDFSFSLFTEPNLSTDNLVFALNRLLEHNHKTPRTTSVKQKKQKSKKKKKKPKAAQRTCDTWFDYEGWAEWNAWQREGPSSRARGGPGAAWFASGAVETRRGCYADCDFPSECRWRVDPANVEAAEEEWVD